VIRCATTSVSVSVTKTCLGGEFGRQRLIVLDDAVVDHGDLVRGVRMRVAFGGAAMGRPARVADADGAGERLFREPPFQIDELALGAAAFDDATNERCDAGTIIATVFETLRPSSSSSETPSRPTIPIIPHIDELIHFCLEAELSAETHSGDRALHGKRPCHAVYLATSQQ
jgi:hypothetical protein